MRSASPWIISVGTVFLAMSGRKILQPGIHAGRMPVSPNCGDFDGMRKTVTMTTRSRSLSAGMERVRQEPGYDSLP